MLMRSCEVRELSCSCCCSCMSPSTKLALTAIACRRRSTNQRTCRMHKCLSVGLRLCQESSSTIIAGIPLWHDISNDFGRWRRERGGDPVSSASIVRNNGEEQQRLCQARGGEHHAALPNRA